MRVFLLGIPLVGGLTVAAAHYCFGVEVWHGIVPIPLIFVFTLIGVNSTALTSITPTSSLGKLTQLTYGALAPKNPVTNVITAGITAEVASNASNLLMDIKPGYMLSAKPRQQAIGHVLRIFAGALVAVPIFHLIFLGNDPQGIISDAYPMPSATVWKAVAELLSTGFEGLKTSARWAVVVGAALDLVCEVLRVATKGRFWISGVGVGLATVIEFKTCLDAPRCRPQRRADLRRVDRRRIADGHVAVLVEKFLLPT